MMKKSHGLQKGDHAQQLGGLATTAQAGRGGESST
jgi:hypothetical protein